MYPIAPDVSYVLSEREDINSILYKPINSTQRIKYTCFNASPSYIILGSSSGSVYLFSREPCLFLQIIPLSEGVVSRVAISPDEKTVALATTRGTVCLVSLKSTPQLISVSTEHIYKQITCICWNNNSTELYVGDAIGRISVMVLSIFTVNGMFQTPVCTLMSLDSSIVQLNFHSPLLLVSTLARSYVCDTVEEQYKQIGNKPRNGEFGACFYTHESNILKAQREERNTNIRGAFNLISDNDINILGENQSKIFCARPGSRLWEVSADGIVVKTHQFKEALAIPPTAIFRSNSTLESSQKKETECEWLPQSVNFSHLFVLACKYLFSYTTSGLYVIDPTNASMLLWSNEYTNISMTAIVDNQIYLMTCDNKFHCITLSSLDSLIQWLYCRERYSECLNACFIYKSQLLKTIGTKEIVELFKVGSLPQDEKELLRPLITLLQASDNNRPAKLNSGIVVVHSENNRFVNKKTYGCDMTPSSQSPEISSDDSFEMQIESGKDRKENLAQENILGTVSGNIDLDYNGEMLDIKEDGHQKSNFQENVTHRIQTDLQSIYELANSFRSNMLEEEIEEIILETDKKMRIIKDSYRDSPGLQSFIYEVTRAAELHYYNMFLENISMQLIDSNNSNYIVRHFVRAFIEINAPAYFRCSCGYPYPMDKTVEPKFLTVGESLFKRYADDLSKECSNICDKVPYMWRVYLPIRIEQRSALDDLLRQCLQTRDNVVLSFLLPALNEQQWNCVGTCLSEIEDSTCLFCATPLAKKSNYDVLIDWSGIVKEIMKREGPDEATAFLIKLEDMIPDIDLDKSIFQSIVFTKMLHRRGLKKSIDFSKTNQLSSKIGTICSPQIRDQLTKVLEKDLRRSIDKNVFGTGAHHWGTNGVAIFRCGHTYHVNCMIERKLTRCNLH
ncbi:PREDICTED: Hermansky-Pudlak syndrome 5 protein homolog isoform X2 [Trachymyrmex septentrionalis]|uniref:Hermansky-Pudlak syndrome 5 protein homolog isoform X2 n=1 Tax=Trachymyrmex septentrionalis TaxID=34720 RepID=UPI00084F4BC9|nr:PREDICTED: Hermansky-Pudlak syndrome 5 protein homolog isoform X2 [Trachymyrmex septentrionalis]